MRISDWSSDVCSSDLQDEGVDAHHHLRDREGGDVAELAGLGDVAGDGADDGEALVEARVVDGEVVERLDAGRALQVAVGELLGEACSGLHKADRGGEDQLVCFGRASCTECVYQSFWNSVAGVS